jgi:phycocyanobilin lyase beta subunit
MTPTIAQLIQAIAQADSAEGLIYAVRTLAATEAEADIPSLVEVLSFNNPGAAVAAVDGLIKIGLPSVSYLLENIDGYNYGARAWATRVLSGVGDVRALDLLIDAARRDFSLSVRRSAARGLGYLNWETVDKEHQDALQTQALEALLMVSHDDEWVVRYSAIAGLEGLAPSLSARLGSQLVRIQERLTEMVLTDEEIAIKARSQLALKSNHG